jgi:hypothetical protein
MLACKRHWFQVSKPVRDQVWATWHRRISPGGGDLAEALENHAAAMDLAIAEMKP